jgi:hypothetical protein
MESSGLHEEEFLVLGAAMTREVPCLLNILRDFDSGRSAVLPQACHRYALLTHCVVIAIKREVTSS